MISARSEPLSDRSSPAVSNSGAIVRLQGLSKSFRRADGGAVPAMKEVSLSVNPGEFLVLLGPSGCGKTTLLRSIAGLERPDYGTIEIFGRTVFASDRKIFVSPERRSLSMIFQSYALWPHMTVFKNVAYPLRSSRGETRSRSEINTEVARVLATVGISNLASRYPHQMSGGQQQRVALARALVGGSRLVLFDEPLSNVDAKVREQLRIEMRAMQQDLEFAAIYVTHDQSEAMQLADRIAVIDGGEVLQIGSPRDLYERPINRFVANFVGTSNEISGTVASVNGDAATVSTALGPIVGIVAPEATGQVVVGSRVVAFWRPERVRVGPEEPGPPNSWQGVVQLSAFVGSHVENTIEIDGIRLRQWTPETATHSPDCARWVHVEMSDIRILPE